MTNMYPQLHPWLSTNHDCDSSNVCMHHVTTQVESVKIALTFGVFSSTTKAAQYNIQAYRKIMANQPKLDKENEKDS